MKQSKKQHRNQRAYFLSDEVFSVHGGGLRRYIAQHAKTPPPESDFPEHCLVPIIPVLSDDLYASRLPYEPNMVTPEGFHTFYEINAALSSMDRLEVCAALSFLSEFSKGRADHRILLVSDSAIEDPWSCDVYVSKELHDKDEAVRDYIDDLYVMASDEFIQLAEERIIASSWQHWAANAFASALAIRAGVTRSARVAHQLINNFPDELEHCFYRGCILADEDWEFDDSGPAIDAEKIASACPLDEFPNLLTYLITARWESRHD